MRRKQAVAGLAGLAVVGAGAYLVTTQMAGDNEVQTRDVGAPAPVVASETPSPEASPAAVVSPSAAASQAPTAPPATSPTPRTAKQRIEDAREAKAKATNQVRQPLAPPTATVAASDIKISVTGSVAKDKEELRLYSAARDMTGLKELAWITEDRTKVGDAECTSTIRLSANAEPRERPTLLICWRTSAAKSVWTVAVKMDGRPSAAKSVAALDKEWARLG